MRLPVVVGLVDGEALEELAMPLEDRLQRCHAQGFAEPTRTRNEVKAPIRIGDEPMEVRGLVHIRLPRLAQGLEVTGIGRYRL